MPTPNDFSNYQFQVQQDDYKQTSREQDDRDIFTKDNEPPLPVQSQGNYPRIFDSGYGPAETPAAGVYPDVYSRVNIPGTNPRSGEFGQSLGTQDGNVTPGNYPNIWGYGDRQDRQEASSKEGDPVKLLQMARKGVDAHADLNEAYGLCQPGATLGQHPWLRDSLADPGEREPGAALPKSGQKVPFEGGE